MGVTVDIFVVDDAVGVVVVVVVVVVIVVQTTRQINGMHIPDKTMGNQNILLEHQSPIIILIDIR